uniref:NADH-ubiquinone oxidoreductase chain 3 n=1 Tax=Hammerschmidtiella sp. ZengetLiu-2016 TaxID=2025463 RepID=A0A3Q8BTF8_9BILA|nr:NADH dehydrogenase subunit 3 [Hammerschmidtiella sp. ZengetLiu-2016]
MFFIMVVVLVFFFKMILILVLYGGEFFLKIKDYSACKVVAFESGFKSVGKIQNSFSIHFFIMMLMFVIFDLEVVMLLGILISDMNMVFIFWFLFMFILGGFYMEWWYGKLMWII